MQPYLIFLLAKGLTSLVLALFGQGFPSAPPFMEWVYAEQQNHFTILVTLPSYLLLSLQTWRLVPRPPGMKVPNSPISIYFSVRHHCKHCKESHVRLINREFPGFFLLCPLQFIFACIMVKYCAVALCRNGCKKRPDLSFFLLSYKAQ